MLVCVCALGTELESFPIFAPDISSIDRNTDILGDDSSDSTYLFPLDYDALCPLFHGWVNAD